MSAVGESTTGEKFTLIIGDLSSSSMLFALNRFYIYPEFAAAIYDGGGARGGRFC